jgi:F0F1-type ATP synthase assembly protein I
VKELTARQDLYQGFGNVLGEAVELVAAPLLFALAGFGLDRWLGWSPVLTIILGLWGLVGGALRAYYRYVERMRVAAEGKPWAR